MFNELHRRDILIHIQESVILAIFPSHTIPILWEYGASRLHFVLYHYVVAVKSVMRQLRGRFKIAMSGICDHIRTVVRL